MRLYSYRFQYLQDPHAGQFSRLPAWLAQHGEAIRAVLRPELLLFGEWCAARHSLDYAALPDWFLLFDVYDRRSGMFWSSTCRNALAAQVGLKLVPQVFCGHTSVKELIERVQNTPSHYRTGPLEGLVIRRESVDWCEPAPSLYAPTSPRPSSITGASGRLSGIGWITRRVLFTVSGDALRVEQSTGGAAGIRL